MAYRGYERSPRPSFIRPADVLLCSFDAVFAVVLAIIALFTMHLASPNEPIARQYARRERGRRGSTRGQLTASLIARPPRNMENSGIYRGASPTHAMTFSRCVEPETLIGLVRSFNMSGPLIPLGCIIESRQTRGSNEMYK